MHLLIYCAPSSKNEFQSFLCIINYLENFSSSTAEVCMPLRKLTSIKLSGYGTTHIKVVWTSKNHHYWRCFNEFLFKNEQVYLEMNALSVELGVGLMQVEDGIWFPKDKAPDNLVLWPISFTSKSLTIIITHYSYTEREALRLHGLCDAWMAINQSWGHKRSTTILVLQRGSSIDGIALKGRRIIIPAPPTEKHNGFPTH